VKVPIEGDNRVAAPNYDANLFSLLKSAPKGYTFSTLSKAGFSQRQAKDLVARYPDLLEFSTRRDVSGRPKACLKLKSGAELPETPQSVPPPAVSNMPPEPVEAPQEPVATTLTPPAQYSLEMDRQRLVELLEFPRYSPWLEDCGMPFDTVKAVSEAFPNLIEISPCELGAKYVWFVQLVPVPDLAVIAEQSQARAVVEAPPVLTEEERRRLEWKPASPGMAQRRGRTGNVEHRKRNPLVELPE
jgi:hypothetical protein